MGLDIISAEMIVVFLESSRWIYVLGTFSPPLRASYYYLVTFLCFPQVLPLAAESLSESLYICNIRPHTEGTPWVLCKLWLSVLKRRVLKNTLRSLSEKLKAHQKIISSFSCELLSVDKYQFFLPGGKKDTRTLFDLPAPLPAPPPPIPHVSELLGGAFTSFFSLWGCR